MIGRNHGKIIYNLISSTLHSCKNIFILVETTANPEVIDDIIKVLALSKINEDCKIHESKKELLKNYLNFHLKCIKIVNKNLVKQDNTVYVNGLIISNFYHAQSQQTDCFVLHVFILSCMCFIQYVSTPSAKS